MAPYDIDLHDNTSDNLTNLAEFTAWKYAKIRQAGVEEGRRQISTERQAEDQAEDQAAIQQLSKRGVSLRDAFGNSSSARGRDAIAIIHQSGVGSKNGVYGRLRRLAAAEGLVK